MRHTFEGPSKVQDPKATSTTPSRIPAPKTDTYLSPPPPSSRPKLKSRASTAKPQVKGKGKGKGKATQWDSDDDDEDDDAYVTSNDHMSPERRESSVNSNNNAGFGNVGEDDDHEIYG